IAASVFPDKTSRVKILKFALIASVGVAFTALYSLIKPGFLFQTGSLSKLAGSLGNSIYLGNYMLANLFLAGLLYFENISKSWKAAVIAIALIDFFVFISAETRGAMLGFLITAAIAILFTLFVAKNKKVRLGILGFVLAASIIVGFFQINRNESWVQKIPGVRRLVNMSFTGGTMATRFIAWNIAVEAWKERPVFGWGPENFYYAFNKYYNPKSLEFSYYETWFDRAHNVVFDHLVFGGTFGLLAYLAIYAVVFGSLFKRWRGGGITYAQLILAAGFFAAAFVQKLTVFDDASSYLIFFVGLAYAQTLLAEPREKTAVGKIMPPRGLSSGAYLFFSLIIIMFTLTLVYTGSVRTFNTSKKLLSALKASMSGLQAAIPAYEEALAMGTAYVKDVEQDYLRKAVELVQNSTADGQTINRALEMAYRAGQNTIKTHPRDIYGFLLLGQLNHLLSYYDPKYIDEAEWAYSKAAELSPKRQQIYYAWGKLRLARRDFAGAIELFQKALDFNRNIADSYWFLGLAQYTNGDKKSALASFEGAIKRNYQFKSPLETALVGNTYFDLGGLEDAVKYYELSLNQSGTGEVYFNAAKVYAALGNRVKAREYGERALSASPEDQRAEIQKFLRML
ncbi:MAG: O-antigen ligase family protein, partial [Patescibacteria group bacterium]